MFGFLLSEAGALCSFLEVMQMSPTDVSKKQCSNGFVLSAMLRKKKEKENKQLTERHNRLKFLLLSRV